MATFDDSLKAIKQYEDQFRRSDVVRLEISGVYDLFPPEVGTSDSAEGGWPDTWPHCERHGAYLIFDESRQLLYVGKASHRVIGARLSHWFPGGGAEPCRIPDRDKWSSRPRYVVAVAVPVQMSFEAPALEEYLIEALDPSDNTHGRPS